MDDIQRKREQLKTAYPSQRWSDKVNKMTDPQVIAIFFRFKQLKKI